MSPCMAVPRFKAECEGNVVMGNHNKTKTRTFARPTKAVNIQLVDEFEVGENVYEALLYHMEQCVESRDLTGWDFHVIDDSVDLPDDGVLT